MAREQERVIVALSRSEAVASGDLDGAFRQIVKAAASTSRARRVGIWKYGRGHVVLRCVWQYDLERGRFTHGEELAATEYPEYFRALDNEVVIAAGVAARDPRTRELRDSYLLPHGISSMLDAPILVGGKLWGVLCMEAVARAPRRWTTADKLFARALADTGASAVSAARRREAADESRRRETHFRSLLETGSEMVVVVNAEGRIQYLSPAVGTILQRRPQDAIGRAFFEFLHPHDVARSTENLRNLKHSAGGRMAIASRVRHADGTWRYVEGVARNLLEDEAVRGIVISARDVTERHWAELEVRALLGISHDVGGTLDAGLLVRRVHRRLAQVVSASFAATLLHDDEGGLRLTAHETLGARVSEAHHKVVLQWAERFDALATSPAPVVLTADDPQTHDIVRGLDLESLAVAALTSRGRRLGILLLGRRSPEPFDARELSLVEAVAKELAGGIDTAALYRLRREESDFSASLLRVGYELLAADDPSSLLERLCQLTVEVLPCDFSRAFALDEDRSKVRMVASFGNTPEEEKVLGGLSVPVSVLGPVLEELEREPVINRPLFPEVAARFSWKAMSAVPLRHGGRIVGVQVAGLRTGADTLSPWQQRLLGGIGQVTSLSLQTRMLVARLEQANRVKSDFISMMSHELRTPLNIILGYTGLLRENAFGEVNDEQANALERVERGAAGLLDLITTTLNLSQLERGNVALDMGEVDVAALVAEVEAQCRSALERPSVVFVADVPPNLPPLITDAGKLRVVLTNLVANALRFTDQGEVRVTVRPKNDGLEIAVSDTGIGIPAHSQQVIFEAFRQAETELLLRRGGVGLGLYIVRRLLDLLQGTVKVESTPGAGATFRVWIPLQI